MAKQEGRYVASALSFRGSETLYGRYWGCEKDINSLHFEACYYRGIKYFLQQETKGMQHYIKELSEHSPFKESQ